MPISNYILSALESLSHVHHLKKQLYYLSLIHLFFLKEN